MSQQFLTSALACEIFGLVGEPRGIFVREIVLADNRRAVRPAPVVPLFSERHQQGVPEVIVLVQGVSRNSDDHLVLRDIDTQRAMQTVPPWKDGAEIGVVLPLHLGMVDAMHARSNEHFI